MKNIFLFIFLAFTNYAVSQDIISKTKTPRKYVLKVSQFDQFIRRFNYDEDVFGNPMSESFSKKVSRNEYIDMLFDQKDNRLINNDKVYSELKNEFVNKVVSNNYRINRLSDSLFGVACCEINYNNKTKIIKLIMKQEKSHKGICWVIYDVLADFIYDKDNVDDGGLMFIPPTSNEVNYIHLKRVLNNKDSIANYAYKDYKCNRLSIFFHLIYTNEIEYKHVLSLQYYIFDIPGYLIQVKEFNRDDDNSGWLIENVVKFNGKPEEYIKKMKY